MSSGPNEVVIKIASTEQQENLKNVRKTLKILQQTATDKENLTGRAPTKPGKEGLVIKTPQYEMSDKIDLKRKKLTDKSIQAGKDLKITEDDLTSTTGPSEHYWEVLAERRRVALAEALEENRELHEARSADCDKNKSLVEMYETLELEYNTLKEKFDALEEENKLQKEMLDETRSLVEVLTEMINEPAQNDASLAEEAIEADP